MAEKNEVCESFNRLFWHDSKLRAFHLFHRDDVDDLVMDIELISGVERKHVPMAIVFEAIAFFICDMDVDGKRVCSDDISSAGCYAESDLKTEIQKERLQYEPDSLRDYFHFSFSLCPPGGSINVIAAGFKLVPSAPEP